MDAARTRRAQEPLAAIWARMREKAAPLPESHRMPRPTRARGVPVRPYCPGLPSEAAHAARVLPEDKPPDIPPRVAQLAEALTRHGRTAFPQDLWPRVARAVPGLLLTSVEHLQVTCQQVAEALLEWGEEPPGVWREGPAVGFVAVMRRIAQAREHAPARPGARRRQPDLTPAWASL